MFAENRTNKSKLQKALDAESTASQTAVLENEGVVCEPASQHERPLLSQGKAKQSFQVDLFAGWTRA